MNDYDWYRRERQAFLWTVGVVGAVVLAGLLAVGAWKLFWAASSSATNHRAHISQQSYGAQSAFEEEIRNDISQYDGIVVQIDAPSTPRDELTALEAQKAAVSTQICDLAGNLTSSTSDISAFVAAHCK